MHDQIDLFAKMGIYYVDAKSDSVVAGARLREDDTETEAYGGVGIEWDLGEFNLFGEISKVDTNVNELTIDIITAGVKYEF